MAALLQIDMLSGEAILDFFEYDSVLFKQARA